MQKQNLTICRKDVLRTTARAEFDAAKEENDPVKISQWIITWKEAVMRIHEKLNVT